MSARAPVCARIARVARQRDRAQHEAVRLLALGSSRLSGDEQPRVLAACELCDRVQRVGIVDADEQDVVRRAGRSELGPRVVEPTIESIRDLQWRYVESCRGQQSESCSL